MRIVDFNPYVFVVFITPEEKEKMGSIFGPPPTDPEGQWLVEMMTNYGSERTRETGKHPQGALVNVCENPYEGLK